MKKTDRKKTPFSVFLISLSVLMLSGCGTSYPELTDEQYEQVVEYAAELALSKDTNKKSRLVSEEELLLKEEKDRQREEKLKQREELKKKLEQEKNELEKNNQEIEQNVPQPVEVTPTYSSDPNELREILSLPDNINIKYTGYQIVKSYPDTTLGGFDGVNSSAGDSLLVLCFELENTLDSASYVDILSTKAFFQIQLDGKSKLNADTTFLEDDLAMFKGSVGPIGTAGVSLVLIKEYPTDTLDRVSEINLIAVRGQSTQTINLK